MQSLLVIPLGNRKNMESKTEDGVLVGNKSDVDICRISLEEKNTSDHCKKTTWSYPADYLLGYDRLYEHHTFVSNGDLPGYTTSATCG
jgi:hypothetical protein